MSEPRQTCKLCGNSVEVSPFVNGFPPDAAKRKLKKLCRDNGCECDPQYTAGFDLRGFVRVVRATPEGETEGGPR